EIGCHTPFPVTVAASSARDLVKLARSVAVEVVITNVIKYCRPLPLVRSPVTTTVAGHNADDVVSVHYHSGRERIAFALARGANHLDVIRSAVSPPAKAPRNNA